MRGVTIGFIIVEILCVIVAAALIYVVIKGTQKPKCKCGHGASTVTGTTCEDLKSLGNDMVQACQNKCRSNVRYATGCKKGRIDCDDNSTFGVGSCCVECVGLKGKPLTYWILAPALIVLPCIIFLPIIFTSGKKHHPNGPPAYHQ